MDTLQIELVKEFIRIYHLKTIEDVLSELPKHMVHIGQEQECFNTYRKRNNPNPNIKPRKTYFEKKIQQLTAYNYLHFLVRKEWPKEFIYQGERIACSCKEMSEIAGILIATLLRKTIYIIGNCIPLYVLGRNTKRVYNHYFNAHIENNKIIFFDSAVYKHIFDSKTQTWVDNNTSLFSWVNINKDYIYRKHFLQQWSNENWFGKREILLYEWKIRDTRAKKHTQKWYFFKEIVPLSI